MGSPRDNAMSTPARKSVHFNRDSPNNTTSGGEGLSPRKPKSKFRFSKKVMLENEGKLSAAEEQVYEDSVELGRLLYVRSRKINLSVLYREAFDT